MVWIFFSLLHGSHSPLVESIHGHSMSDYDSLSTPSLEMTKLYFGSKGSTLLPPSAMDATPAFLY